MRILLFSDSDVFAGTERHILELACGLSVLGCPPIIACPGHGELARRAGASAISVLPVPKCGRIDWPAALWLRNALRQDKFDLIHVHNGRTALIAALAIGLAGRGACVATQHFVQPARASRRGIARMASRWLHAASDRRVVRYIATSQAVRQGMLDRRETTPDKVAVILNGIGPIDTASLDPASSVRQRLHLAPGAHLVLYVGRLEPEKGVADLVEAMQLVAADDHGVRCVVAGSGSEHSAINQQIKRAGLEQVVRLIGFQLDVASLINAADVFVLPSLAEAFGLVLVEAMQFAKPVVATRSGGPAEIVVDGETGILIAPSRPHELAQAINKLLRDETLRQRMGLAGRERFAAQFTSRHMAAATLAVYRSVVAERAGAAPCLSAPRRRPVAAEARSDVGR